MKLFRASEDNPKPYLGKEVLALKLCGLSLSGNEGTGYKIYSFVVLLVLNYTYPFVQLSGVLLHPDDDVDSETIACMCGIFLVMAKTAAVLRKRVQLGEILAKLEKEPFAVNPDRGGDAEEKLIKECLWITSVQSRVCFVAGICSLCGPAAYTLIMRIRSSDYHDWKLPFGEISILDLTVSPHYEIAWLYQMLSLTSIAVHFIAIDLIVASVLCHICYQFKLLQNNLRRMVKNSHEFMRKGANLRLDQSPHVIIDESKIPWTYLQKSLEQTVNYHLAVINIAEEMEQVFNVLLLTIFLYTIIVLCFLVYRLSMLPLDDPEILLNLVEIMTYCLQVGMVCFWGEQVIHESQEVGTAAFEASFVGTDLRFQKALVLVVRRSQVPIKITAGKFFDICLASFVWIMRTTYSSFMLLRNLKEV